MKRKANGENRCKSCGKLLVDEKASYCERCRQKRKSTQGAVITALTGAAAAAGAVVLGSLRKGAKK